MKKSQYDPFDYKKQMEQKKEEDPFVMVAIKFILGIGVGFSLICIGFIFLMMALLANASDPARYSTSPLVWLFLGLGSEAFGGFLMWINLKDAPKPGDIATS